MREGSVLPRIHQQVLWEGLVLSWPAATSQVPCLIVDHNLLVPTNATTYADFCGARLAQAAHAVSEDLGPTVRGAVRAVPAKQQRVSPAAEWKGPSNTSFLRTSITVQASFSCRSKWRAIRWLPIATALGRNILCPSVSIMPHAV